ncbi:unnamed protein product [Darwinula stevensoni]|uniref:C-type lectin domain-containing protein n=1 Tax=Darwinula stevensoni TaxID=69355 RepID=A0A7R8XCI3_9CRUS|nr:unnamed protein product [Darwinula stevensoni]CAG0892223.1 unnamed protein product [Darwinula stevensoni]
MAHAEDQEPRCEPDWIRFQDSCYYFADAKMTQIEARSFCLDHDGDLVSIHSPEEQIFVEDNVVFLNTWIGAYLTGSLKDDPWNFEFYDGSSKDYHQIPIDHDWPFRPGTAGEGLVLRPFLLKNVDCSLKKRNFYCDGAFVPPNCYCQSGFDHPADRCFREGAEAMTLDDANEHCHSFVEPCEYHAAILHHEQYNLKVFSGVYLRDREDDGDPPGRFWVNLIRNPETGDWETMGGSHPNVTHWHWDGYPTEDGGDCVTTFVSSWFPEPAAMLYGLICKKPLA